MVVVVMVIVIVVVTAVSDFAGFLACGASHPSLIHVEIRCDAGSFECVCM